MNTSNWIRIAPAGHIPVREGRTVRLGSTTVAIFNTGMDFLAVENRCPHGGGPLADGIVSGNSVTCPLHNWRVCLESGQVERPCDTAAPAVRTYATRVEDGIVMLDVSDLRRAKEHAA
jgi:nitrite reductase (NADH) small subunit